jgi:hypothetical protein
MKHLYIKYNETVLFDAEVAEISWQDNDDGVTVTGKNRKVTGGSIFDLLSAAAKKQSEDEIEKRKQDFAAEKAVLAENTIDADQ